MKTLYLHIGTPKSGTTSIQHFCYTNRELLKELGYCYPVLPFEYEGKLPERNALFLNGVVHDESGARDVQEEKRRLETGFEMVRSAFETYDYVVLSDEAVWMTAFVRMKGIWKRIRSEAELGGYAVRIIVYLRRQDEFVESWWNQRVKSDLIRYNVMKWDYFLENHAEDARPDYYRDISKIAGVFGKENVIVRRFDRNEFKDGSIQKDFLDAIGLEWTEDFLLPEDQENLNSRLLGNSVEVKRIINTIPDMNWKDNRFFRKVALQDAEIAGKQYHCAMFSEEEARAYVKQFEEGNRKLAEEYMGDGKPMFSDEYKKLPKWDPDNPYLYEDIIRFMAIADRELLHQIESLKKENKRLSGRLKKLEDRLQKLEDMYGHLKEKLEAKCRQLDEQLRHPIRTAVRMFLRKVKRKLTRKKKV